MTRHSPLSLKRVFVRDYGISLRKFFFIYETIVLVLTYILQYHEHVKRHLNDEGMEEKRLKNDESFHFKKAAMGI
jgi:hypothetical protein